MSAISDDKDTKKPTKKRCKTEKDDDVSFLLLQKVVNTMERCNEKQESIAHANYQLALKKEEKEGKEWENKQECQHRQEEREEQAFQAEQWRNAMAIIVHENPIIWQAGERLAKSLTEKIAG